jgi:hypothetical protein
MDLKDRTLTSHGMLTCATQFFSLLSRNGMIFPLICTWISLFTFGIVVALNNTQCELLYPRNNLPLQVFWLNLDKSIDRRMFMQQQLKYYGLINYHRVRGLISEQIVIKLAEKDDEGCLFAKDNRSDPKTETESENYMKSLLAINGTNGGIGFIGKSSITSHYISQKNKLISVLALCGRPRNTIGELIVALSHVNAINYACNYNSYNHRNNKLAHFVHDKQSQKHTHATNSSDAVDLNDYALILEDDLQFAFEIDFHQLVSLAPKDFAIIQLVTSNDHSVLNLWRVFDRHKLLFVKRKSHDDYWCAGAYLINKARLQSIANKILYKHKRYNYFEAKILTGYDNPCHPRACCTGSAQDSISSFNAAAPCVKAARGYAADNLIFTLSEDTYMLTVPIITSSVVGNVSTLHQQHVTFHQPAFHRMMEYTNRMARSSNPVVKSFINSRCRFVFSPKYSGS